ncbi:MAG: phosphoribosylformylglycinamidine cyclo-ligase, partial [Magnetococcales bacterium]|nr:phosphoribosylformylglycinamidine cyclo-ligase [Magnetococcales bacterium]
ERDAIIDGKSIQPGDRILGLASSGPHSNGYSLIRKLVLADEGPGLNHPFRDTTLGEALLTPTRIYVRSLLALMAQVKVKGMAHITGGGFWENIPRILPEQVVASLRPWTIPPLFRLLQDLGHITDQEMLRTFNCGIGMVVIVPEQQADLANRILTENGETVLDLGEVTPRLHEEPQVVLHG